MFGGRASSKSWDAAGVAIALATVVKYRFLCTRQIQNKIDESVYALLKIQIFRFGLQHHFKILDNKIICTLTGSEFIFYGLWRHINEIRSLEGIDVHWSEEASGLTQAQWEVIEPTLRKGTAEHWLIFNPILATDFVYKEFVTGPQTVDIGHNMRYDSDRKILIRKINYDENPFLDQEFISSVVNPLKLRDEDTYNHVYLGMPRDDDDEAIIKRSWCMAAIDAHKKLNVNIRGIKLTGFDVGDTGDPCATISSLGSLVYDADMWKAKEDELLKSCSRVWSHARQHESTVIYDAIGVGASAGAKFKELNDSLDDDEKRVSHTKFFAGGAPFKPDADYRPAGSKTSSGIKNKDMFSNIKAQAWWITADRLRNTYNAVTHGDEFRDDEMLFIDGNLPHLDKLIDELCTPKRHFDLASRVKVESKDDLKKRQVASPNLADAFVMVGGGAQSLPIKISMATMSRLSNINRR